MSMPLWFYNLAIYCAQFAMLIAAGALMVAVTRLREPRLRLIYWQALLALGVLLPAIEPWQTAPKIEQGMAQAGVSAPHAGSIGVDSALAPPAHAAPSFSIYQIVAILLLAGLVYRLIWLTAGLIRLRRSRLCGHPLGPHAAVEQFKAAFNVSPAVIVSDRISSPVTFGWRTPKVMLPRKFTEMEDARQRAVLCHEFLHVRRRDWLWHVAEEILRSFFWFHLAVAWLIAQIRLCREQLVDREVVLLAGSRRDYLDALFEIASPSHYSRHAPALLFLSERHLKQRVKLILKEVTMSRKKLALALSASLGGLILTGVVAAALIPLRTSAAHASSEASVQAPAVRPDTHFYGNPNAKVTVVEFGDFQCPACREAASVAEQVRKDMGSEVRFAYRQFPLTKVHHQAEKAAEAAECSAQQGKFWQAVNYLSDHPLDFSNSGIRQFAASLGLDQAQTMQCLSSGSMAARVQQDIRDGRALGVRSVPTFLIGNTMVVGLQPYSRLHSLIEQKLRANGNAQSMTPSSSNMLSAASLEPTFAEGLNGQATGTPPQKARPAADPQPQSSQNTLTDMTKEHNAYINQAEIQRQIDEAMKQAKIAQGAASKIDQAKIQQQIDQAMKQAKIAQENFAKIDQAKIQHQVEEAMKKAEAAQEAVSKIDQAKIQQQVDEAMKQLQKVETPEMRRQYEKALKQFQKTNTPEMRRQYEEALKKLKMAQMTAPKIDQAKLRQQVEQAMEQAKIAQQDAAKVNKAEIQRKLDQLRKQAEQARKETEAARKEAEKARQDMMKARRQAEAQPKATKPAPSATPEPPPVPPTPASPSPDKVEPPAPPPASPQPPPVPPSSDKLMPPPNPLPASPAPPSPPQN